MNDSRRIFAVTVCAGIVAWILGATLGAWPVHADTGVVLPPVVIQGAPAQHSGAWPIVITTGGSASFGGTTQPLSVTSAPTRGTSTTTACSSVSVRKTVLASNIANRLEWGIIVTSGAGVIYYQQGTTASAQGASSIALGTRVGQLSFTDNGPIIYGGAVTAVALSGTSWVCTYEVTP